MTIITPKQTYHKPWIKSIAATWGQRKPLCGAWSFPFRRGPRSSSNVARRWRRWRRWRPVGRWCFYGEMWCFYDGDKITVIFRRWFSNGDWMGSRIVQIMVIDSDFLMVILWFSWRLSWRSELFLTPLVSSNIAKKKAIERPKSMKISEGDFGGFAA